MRLAAAIAFGALLLAWTILLLVPNPVPSGVKELLGFWDHAMFVVAKSTHAGAYLVLTLLGVAGFGWRHAHWVVVALILHGAATEFGQTLVPNRGGTVRDALIDAAGVMLGYFLARRRVR